jgi:hypothetical protein
MKRALFWAALFLAFASTVAYAETCRHTRCLLDECNPRCARRHGCL